MQLSTSGKSRFRALVFITLAAALMRLLPHPYNFTPVAGMALFGGAHFRDVRVATRLMSRRATLRRAPSLAFKAIGRGDAALAPG